MSQTPITDAYREWFKSKFQRDHDDLEDIDVFLQQAFKAGAEWCKDEREKPTIFDGCNQPTPMPFPLSP